jgi:hypothetical protein
LIDLFERGMDPLGVKYNKPRHKPIKSA